MCGIIKEENLTKVCQYVDDYKEMAWHVTEETQKNFEMGLITKQQRDRFRDFVWRIVEEHNTIMRMLMPPTEV